MRKAILLMLSFLLVLVNFANPAHAVIPQLLGPLSALLSIIPQILAFVGIALITVLVFARDTTKMFFYRLRDFAVAHKAIASGVALVTLVALMWSIYYLIGPLTKPVTTAVNTNTIRTGTPISPWTTFRGNQNRTGYANDVPGPASGNPVWIFAAKDAVAVDFSSSPAVTGNRLYIGASRGSIFALGGATYCIDIEKGEELWRHDSDIPIFSSPAVAGGRVYIGEGYHQDSRCHLRCLDAKTGELIWSFRTESHVESTPFISQGKLYFTAGADGVYCVDALEGKLIWHYPAVHADMSPLVHKGKVYFGTGYGDYRVYAVDAQTGKEIWTIPMPYPVWGSPSIYQTLVFFGLGTGNFSDSASNPNGRVVAINADTGESVWEYEAKDAVLTAIASHNGYVTFGARDGFVYTLIAKDGKKHWATELGAPVVSSPAVAANNVYVAAQNGRIYALSVDDGEVEWEFNMRDVARGIELYSSPAIANGHLYIGSSDRYIFCLGGKGSKQHHTDR